MSGTSPEVWLMTSDEHDVIRASAVVAVHIDPTGTVAVRLGSMAHTAMTLMTGSIEKPTPPDFHRQMTRMVAELADSSGAQLVRAHHDGHAWHWVTEPL